MEKDRARSIRSGIIISTASAGALFTALAQLATLAVLAGTACVVDERMNLPNMLSGTLAVYGEVTLVALAILMTLAALFVRHSWFVGVNGTTVGIYQGIHADVFGHPLYSLVETTSVQLTDLPETVAKSLEEGVVVSSEAEAAATVESYRDQIDADKTAAAEAAEKATDGAEASKVTHDETAETSAQAESNPADISKAGGRIKGVRG